MDLFIRPVLFDNFPRLLAAASTRHGGVSPSPYASLNLGLNTDDQDENVQENRHRFFTALGLSPERLAASYQVHGREVLLATGPGLAHGYDAIITREPGLAISVTTADCTPVLVYDAARQAIAAIHAGWRGAAQGVVSGTLQRMQEVFGTVASDCYAYIGPCISQGHYEVDDKVASRFSVSHSVAGKAPGKWMLGLKSANQAQLLEFGIPEKQIETTAYCTWADNEHFFSHRRERGTTGRMLAVIALKENR